MSGTRESYPRPLRHAECSFSLAVELSKGEGEGESVPNSRLSATRLSRRARTRTRRCNCVVYGQLFAATRRNPARCAPVALIFCVVYTVLYAASAFNQVLVAQASAEDADASAAPSFLVLLNLACYVAILSFIVSLRQRVRNNHVIAGTGCEDCCAAACCASCVMCQMARHEFVGPGKYYSSCHPTGGVEYV